MNYLVLDYLMKTNNIKAAREFAKECGMDINKTKFMKQKKLLKKIKKMI